MAAMNTQADVAIGTNGSDATASQASNGDTASQASNGDPVSQANNGDTVSQANNGDTDAAASSGPAPTALSPEQQEQAAETFRQLGEVATLMTASPQHRYMFIGDLEWMGLPAIVQRQCYLYRDNGRTLAAVFWARVSGEIEDRFKRGVMKLAPAEWRSGDNLWLVNVVDPFKQGEALLKAFAADEQGAKGSGFSFITVNDKGQRVVARWSAEK